MPGYAQIARDLMPPLVWKFGKKRMPKLVRAFGGHFTHIRFSGDYKSWDEARRASAGYDAPSILQKTRDALLKVKNGEYRWEQDSMVSNSDATPSALLAALARIAAVKGKPELHVIDFGGSLGSTYFWCRPFFANDFKLNWSIVEQPEHVKAGRHDFQDDQLRFYFNVEEAVARQPADVLLLSAVLHYLKDPESWLNNLGRWAVPHLILDRTILWEKDQHRLTVQEVPKEIYPATYPAWFLSKRKILSLIERDYRLTWQAPDAETWEVDRESAQNSLYIFTRCR